MIFSLNLDMYFLSLLTGAIVPALRELFKLLYFTPFYPSLKPSVVWLYGRSSTHLSVHPCFHNKKSPDQSNWATQTCHLESSQFRTWTLANYHLIRAIDSIKVEELQMQRKEKIRHIELYEFRFRCGIDMILPKKLSL